jgi:hydroxyproline oxidase
MKYSSLILRKVAENINKNVSVKYLSRSTPAGFKNSPKSDGTSEFRMTTAPWIRIGEFQKGLMSHLSTFEIMRALFVLKLCSYDFFVDRAHGLIQLYQKLGKLLEWPVRQTFFNQFVGGDTIPRMKHVVDTMHSRGVQLLFCPVLEEDIEDERSTSKVYDNNLKTLLELVELTSSLESEKAMFQLKPTAFIPAVTLEKVSEAINQRCRYDEPEKLAKLIEELAKCVDNPAALSLNFDKEESAYFFDGIKRADILIQKAKAFPVHVLVDAEFYSCKPAISAIALALMARHNGNGHFVGNTIQTYLKESFPTIKAELQAVTKEIGVNWFGKIVRGAYMDRERYLAKKRGYESPIWDSYEETNKSYNKAVAHVLEHIAAQPKEAQTHLVIAGHNERSIRLAAQKMKDLGLRAQCGLVSFGQIYGMSDYLSTPLVQEGYNVYKSTPFGPIEGVLPYLARRASENRSVIKGAREERDMLRRELKTRISSK